MKNLRNLQSDNWQEFAHDRGSKILDWYKFAVWVRHS